jgi:hypothetical protein
MTAAKQRAALLVATGKLTEPEIASAVKITDRQLRRWKQEPEFRAEVGRQQKERRARLDAWRDRIIDCDIADRSKRIARLDADQKALDAIRAARSVDPTLSKLPGGDTGLVTITGIRKIKVQVKDPGTGKVSVKEQTIVVHEADLGMLAESRALSEQAARELGERTEKHEMTGPDGSAITIELMDAILRRRRDGNPGTVRDQH